MRKKVRLEGCRVVITGASRGIGAATAKRLCQLGARVALVGIEPELMQSVVAGMGNGAFFFEADVTDKQQVTDAINKAAQALGGLDVVIANAGIVNISTLAYAPENAVEKTLQVNLFGVWHTMKASIPHLLNTKGYFLTISSVAALGHGPLQGAYSASKAGVEALTDCLRIELNHEGVDVGCAYFGAFDTDLTSGAKSLESIKILEEYIPAVIRKVAPISKAVDAIEKGILKRSHRIWAPGYVGAFLFLRGVAQPLLERKVMANPLLAKSIDSAKRQDVHGHSVDPSVGVSRLVTKKPH